MPSPGGVSNTKQYKHKYISLGSTMHCICAWTPLYLRPLRTASWRHSVWRLFQIHIKFVILLCVWIYSVSFKHNKIFLRFLLIMATCFDYSHHQALLRYRSLLNTFKMQTCCPKQWRTVGGWGVQNPPPPEIPKALQNRAKLTPIVKTVKNCWFSTPTPQDVQEKGSKILKLPRFAIVLH